MDNGGSSLLTRGHPGIEATAAASRTLTMRLAQGLGYLPNLNTNSTHLLISLEGNDHHAMGTNSQLTQARVAPKYACLGGGVLLIL